MDNEDKDFIMRQIRTFAMGLGALLSKDSLRDFIEYKHYDSKVVSDGDLDDLVAFAEFQTGLHQAQASLPTVAKTVGMSLERLQALLQNREIPTDEEMTAIKAYLKQA
ncbi:hypothetical protein [Schleiferilactobacillus shenzhenensis]|uniref:hypothetical protein n=1 Tax=Schleiferilactobacillus shenzhenensis TaxID=1231337 RepID=UPI00041B59CF|nr:hypothetical protein [Schleiferilactobacillus shenzhenensis]